MNTKDPNQPPIPSDKKSLKRRNSPAVVVKNWMIGSAGEDESAEDSGLLHQEIEEILTKVGQRTYLVLICYDISEPKRLVRVAKTCLAFGERVQKSVFECHLSQRQLNNLIAQVVPLINEEIDYLRIYKIAGIPQVQVWGKIPLTSDEDLIII